MVFGHAFGDIRPSRLRYGPITAYAEVTKGQPQILPLRVRMTGSSGSKRLCHRPFAWKSGMRPIPLLTRGRRALRSPQRPGKAPWPLLRRLLSRCGLNWSELQDRISCKDFVENCKFRIGGGGAGVRPAVRRGRIWPLRVAREWRRAQPGPHREALRRLSSRELRGGLPGRCRQ